MIGAGWKKLALAVLQDWILSGDPLHGDPWRLWCSVAGVDPWVMREKAEWMRKRQGIE